MGLLWLALDGVGHPADAPPDGPWAQPLPQLEALLARGAALDATLGVPGLPQSATGQSCWLTGRDAVRVMGEHYGPQPGPTLRALLLDALPARLIRAGGRAALLNHYPPGYFTRRRPAHGCFPQAFLDAGLDLNPPGLPLAPVTLGLNFASPWSARAPEAEVVALGRQLGEVAGELDLAVLDLWFSDLLGHQGRDPTPPELLAAGRAYLRRLDSLIEGALDAGAGVVISSDHGNFEDLRVKGHTLARVPFAASGHTVDGVGDIVQGGQAIAGWLGLSPG